MSPSSSTLSRARKTIFWLFLDPVNTNAESRAIDLSGYDWVNMRVDEFMEMKLSPAMQKWFDFHPRLSTLRLWIPRDPIPLQDITTEWAATNAKDFNPVGIAAPFNQTVSTINSFLGLGQPLREPPEKCLHLIVTAKRQEQQQEHEHEEKRDALTDLGSQMYQNYLVVTKGPNLPLPSSAAKSSQYAKLQTNPQTTIYDGFYNVSRPVNTSALPIEIYHPVFQRFMGNISTAKPDKELLTEIHGLMTISTGVGTIEEPLAQNLRSALTNILGKYMGRAVVSGATPDGTIQKTGRKNSIPLLVMEYKRAVGEGGCDPLTQASYSAWKYWQDKRLEGARDKCCCPTFIVAGGGPYLAILGAIITDKYIVQRLTGLEWLGMGRVFEDNHLYRIAQVFDSLREALRELDEFHDDLDKQDLKLVDGKPHPRFYPYCTTFTDYTSKATKEFEYLRPLTLSNKSPFLVRFKSSGKMAVVKFVARYGAEAHQILAEAGMAPRLLFCGSIDGRDDVRNTSGESTKDVFGLRLGPPRMVVMEYIDGTHGEVLEAGDRPKDTHAQIKAMVDKLHGSDYVFGDLRPPNIVFSGGKPYLVDFDWAGKYGETFYPTELGEGITEHCEGKDLEIIEKDHDLALLDHYFLQT